MSKKKPLRFAALIRVSTDKQAKKGESLKTQRNQISDAVDLMHGEVVKWYEGQEHATEGYERELLNQLLSDAQRKKKIFDAVIVADPSRWSRDNVSSKQGLSILKKHGIKFYVLAREISLHSRGDQFIFGIETEVNAYTAGVQKDKSLLNRINRAKRGIPTGGKLPYGRTFNKETCQWDIDKDKHRTIKDVAKRYIAGESLIALAKEYEINHTNLLKALRDRSGEDWEIKFNTKDLDTDEDEIFIPMKVPRLLSEKTIEAIRRKVIANTTYDRKEIKHKYLLSSLVFCDHCGYAMNGQPPNGGSHRCYRHAYKERLRKCSPLGKSVRADDLEENVLRLLFDTFGNPKAVQAAIDAATPNKKATEKLLKRQTELTKLIEKVSTRRNRIINLVTRDKITENDADKHLDDLNEDERRYQEEFDRIEQTAMHMPSPEGVKDIADKLSKRVKKGTKSKRLRGNARLAAQKKAINRAYESMTWDEKRHLIKSVFGGTTPDGKRQGVYISWELKDGKPVWRYEIRGQITSTALLPKDSDQLNEQYEYEYDPTLHAKLARVTKYVRRMASPTQRFGSIKLQSYRFLIQKSGFSIRLLVGFRQP